jgi:predicted MFS family arabinose efflux permease
MWNRDPRDLRVVMCLFAVLFLGVADNQTLSPLLPEIRKALGKSAQETGLLFTGYSLCAAVSVLLWGPISDLFGRKRGLVVGMLLFSAGSWASFLSTGFAGLLAGRIATGAGASMISLNAISYAADFFPYATRGWAMGVVFSSYFAALILGVPLGSMIAGVLGWRSVFALAGGTAVPLALVCSRLPGLPAAARMPGLGALLLAQAKSYLGFVRVRRTLTPLLASLAASAATMGFLAYLGVWLHDAFGIGTRQAGLVFIASGAAALLASPYAGSLSDRLGKRPLFLASNLSLAVVLMILPQLRWGPALFLVFGSISVATAFRQGPMEALMTEVAPAASRGSFVALKNSFSQLGIALTTALSGVLFDAWGYAAVCALGAVMCLGAAGAMLFAAEPGKA